MGPPPKLGVLVGNVPAAVPKGGCEPASVVWCCAKGWVAGVGWGEGASLPAGFVRPGLCCVPGGRGGSCMGGFPCSLGLCCSAMGVFLAAGSCKENSLIGNTQ